MPRPESAPGADARAPTYLARLRPWTWHDAKRIDVLDEEAQRVLATLDDWQTLVYFYADGNRTADDALTELRRQYRDPAAVPARADESIASATRDLVDELGFVELRVDRRTIPYHLDLPVEEQDPDEAARSRAADAE